MIPLLLILHSLVGVALLGATTHQSYSLLRRSSRNVDSFLARYGSVNQASFTGVIALLFVMNVLLGALLYPKYRLEVRIPFEEMQLGWAVGIFELKEHFAGLGLGVLPLYTRAWRKASDGADLKLRIGLTLTLTLIVWWNFLVGHVLNNIRGLP